MSEIYASNRRLWTIAATLTVLLIATVVCSQLPLGRFQLITGLGFASAKAVLIVLFFMNLRHEQAVVRVVVIGVFLWLLILLGLVVIDDRTREPTSGIERGPAAMQTQSTETP